jgi:hypothetical protein
MICQNTKYVSKREFSTYGVCLCDLNELIDCFGIVRVLIWMFFSGKLSVGLLYYGNWRVHCNSQDVMRNKGFKWLNVLDFVEADVEAVPAEKEDSQSDQEELVDPLELVDRGSL